MQFDEHWGLDAGVSLHLVPDGDVLSVCEPGCFRSSFRTVPTVHVRVALVTDVTPVSWLSIGFGPVVWWSDHHESTSNNPPLIGTTLRIGFHVGRWSYQGARSAVSIHLVGDGGLWGSSSGLLLGAEGFVMLGYQLS